MNVSGINLNLYDFNKINMDNIKPYDTITLNRLCKKTIEDIWSRFSQEDYSYWMLLCRERNDYTVFRLEDSQEEFYSALLECLNNRGKVLDITKQPDDNYEIWIKDSITGENFAYYLFDYNNAIIEV